MEQERDRTIRGEFAIGATAQHTCIREALGWGLDHDAAMRIGGDAPGDGPILWDGVEAMPASGHRHLGSLAAPRIVSGTQPPGYRRVPHRL